MPGEPEEQFTAIRSYLATAQKHEVGFFQASPRSPRADPGARTHLMISYGQAKGWGAADPVSFQPPATVAASWAELR